MIIQECSSAILLSFIFRFTMRVFFFSFLNILTYCNFKKYLLTPNLVISLNFISGFYFSREFNWNTVKEKNHLKLLWLYAFVLIFHLIKMVNQWNQFNVVLVIKMMYQKLKCSMYFINSNSAIYCYDLFNILTYDLCPIPVLPARKNWWALNMHSSECKINHQK